MNCLNIFIEVKSMENGIYGALAPIYDELQSDIDYSLFADLYEKAFSDRFYTGI